MNLTKIIGSIFRKNSKKTLPIFVLLFIFILSFGGFSLFMFLYQTPNIPKENPNQDAQSIINSCKQNQNKEICYINQFGLFSKTHDLALVTKVLKEAQTKDTSINFCHTIAHKISNIEVSKNPNKWLTILSQVDPLDCNMGFFHGVIEGHMQSQPDYLLDQNSINNMCLHVKGSVAQPLKSLYQRNCIHSASHILLVQENDDVQKSLAICSKLNEEDLKEECYYGIFMEDDQRQNLQIHGFQTAAKKGFLPKQTYIDECNGYKDSSQQITCWQSRAWIFYRLDGLDTEAMYDSCNKAVNTEAVIRCYTRGLGIIISTDQFSNNTKVKVVDFCAKMQDSLSYQECQQKFLEYIIDIGGGKNLNQYSYNYCSVVKDDIKDDCNAFVTKILTKRNLQKSTLIPEDVELLNTLTISDH